MAENSADVYNETEIAKWTGLSESKVKRKLFELMDNGIVEIKSTFDDVNSYQLARNDITRKLIGAVFENGLYLATKDD